VEYRNPQPPEGINVSQTHPLLDFLRLLGGLLVIAAIVFVALALLAHDTGSLGPPLATPPPATPGQSGGAIP